MTHSEYAEVGPSSYKVTSVPMGTPFSLSWLDNTNDLPKIPRSNNVNK